MFASILTSSRSIINKQLGSESQKFIGSFIFDDDVKIINSFDLNKVASLTYNNDTCFEIFELLDDVVARPAEFTVLAITKALAVIKHIVTYGSEKGVNQAWVMGNRIKDLQNYNTVILAMSNPNSVSAIVQRIQGGSVDQGHVVRKAAEDLHSLLSSPQQIRSLRDSCQDSNSLVPIGDLKTAAFVSDDVRHQWLREKMLREQGLLQRSNLKLADNSFGSGFNASEADRRVIGAAHSLEEMIAKAAREKSKFSDGGPSKSEMERKEYVVQLQRDLQREAATADLLGISDVYRIDAKPPFPDNNRLSSKAAPVLFGMDSFATPVQNSNTNLLDVNYPTLNTTSTNVIPMHEDTQSTMMMNNVTSASAISGLDFLSSSSSIAIDPFHGLSNIESQIHPQQTYTLGIPPPQKFNPSFIKDPFDSLGLVSSAPPPMNYHNSLPSNNQPPPEASFHSLSHLPPPPVQPPPEPHEATFIDSSMIPLNVDGLSPDQRSQYLQQLLLMNQQIINMMMQNK